MTFNYWYHSAGSFTLDSHVPEGTMPMTLLIFANWCLCFIRLDDSADDITKHDVKAEHADLVEKNWIKVHHGWVSHWTHMSPKEQCQYVMSYISSSTWGTLGAWRQSQRAWWRHLHSQWGSDGRSDEIFVSIQGTKDPGLLIWCRAQHLQAAVCSSFSFHVLPGISSNSSKSSWSTGRHLPSSSLHMMSSTKISS